MPRVLGIAIDERMVRTVVMVRRGSGVFEQSAHVVEIKGEGTRRARLTDALSKVRDLTGQVDDSAIVLAGSLVSPRRVTMPFADREKIANTVKFEIEGLLPRPPEAQVADSVPIHTTTHGASVLAVAVEKALIADVISACESTGFDPVSIDERMLAAWRLISSHTEMDGDSLMVYGDEHRLEALVLIEGAPRMLRTIFLEREEETPLDENAVLSAVNELARAASIVGAGPEKLILLGPAVSSELMRRALENILDLECSVPSAATPKGFDAPADYATLFQGALAAARTAAGIQDAVIDLRREEFFYKKRFKALAKPVALFFLALAVVFGALAYGRHSRASAIRREVAGFQREAEKTWEELFPGAPSPGAAVADSIRSARNQLQDETAQEGAPLRSFSALDALQKVMKRVPVKVKFIPTRIEVSHPEGEGGASIRIKAETDSPENAEVVQRAIKTDFLKVVIKDISTPRTGKTTFDLEIEVMDNADAG